MVPKPKIDKKEVYKLLVGTHEASGGYQFTANKIAVYLKCSRVAIHKIVNEFLKKGIINCDNPKDYHNKFYSVTGKSYEQAYGKITEQTMLTKSRPSREIALQKAKYTIEIEREYSEFFKKQRRYDRGNCAHYKFSTTIFDNCGKWEFEKAGKKTLVITVPEMVFEKRYLAQARSTIFTIVYEAIKWFCKKAKIKVRWETLHLCEKPHVQRPARDSKAIRITQDFSLNIDGKMLDMSSGKADWETTVLDEHVVDAVSALETWDLASFVNSSLQDFELRLCVLEDKASNVEEWRPKLNEKINSIIETMNEIKNIVNPETKPIDEQDPAFG